MEHQNEPCASLPKTHITLDLTHCQAHQAWTLTTHVYTEDGDTIRDVGPCTVVRFGPFDDWLDVQSTAVRALADEMYRVDPLTSG